MEENHLQADQALHYSDMLAVAERLPVTIVDGAAHRSVNSPSMEGVLLGLEVQQGLLATGYDVRFLKDFQIESTVEPSVICAVQLSGSVGPMKVDGVGEIGFEHGRPVLLCFGMQRWCSTICRAGRRAAVGGFTLDRSFLTRMAALDGDGQLQVLDRLFDCEFKAMKLPESQDLRIAAAQMVERRCSGTLERLYLEGSALAFVAEAARLIEGSAVPPDGMSKRHYDQVVRARELLDHDVATPPSIEMLTKALGVNVTTLRANFLKTFGTTIFGHVRNRRLEIAQFLLRTHTLSISEVAYRVGFTNAGAFSSAYRTRYGRSPREEQTSRTH